MTLQAIRVKLTATSAVIIVVYQWLRFVYEKGKHEDQEKRLSWRDKVDRVKRRADFLGKLTRLKNYTFEYFQRKHLELQGATREEARKQVVHTRAKKHQTFEPHNSKRHRGHQTAN
jgi:hypothetical protein